MKCNIREYDIHYEKNEKFFECVAKNGWEPHTFDIIDRFIGKGSVLLDVGAWNGVISLYAAARGATCYSIEPDVVAYQELTDNIIINSFEKRIFPFNIAISDRSERAPFYTMSEFGDSQSSLVKRGAADDSYYIQTESLKDFIQKKGIKSISLIKIDTEGSEIFMIDSMVEMRIPMFVAFHCLWWPNLEEGVDLVVKKLFPVFDFGCTEEYFRGQMRKDGNHEYLLIPK